MGWQLTGVTGSNLRLRRRKNDCNYSMQVGKSSFISDDHVERVADGREEYKRTLLELLAVVMHPPEFTDRTGRYTWCIGVNRLLVSAPIPKQCPATSLFRKSHTLVLTSASFCS